MPAHVFSDTHPKIELIQLELMRQAPVWKKLNMVGQMYQTTKLLSLSGLRHRYPEASDAQLRRRLADLLLGPELAAKAYGPMSAAHNR